MSWWLVLTLGSSPGGEGEGPDDGVSSPPPSGQDEGVSRLATPAGEAAIVLHLARAVIAEGEAVEFCLVNRGQVVLISGQHFRRRTELVARARLRVEARR